jgi:hypothetical protein
MLKRSERKRRYLGPLPDSKALLRDLLGKGLRWTKAGLDLQPSDGLAHKGCRWQIKQPLGSTDVGWFASKRGVVRAWIDDHPRRYGRFMLKRQFDRQAEHFTGRWLLFVEGVGQPLASWVVRPTRKALAQVIRAHRMQDPRPSWRRPDTLGWRGWKWDTRQNCLRSPSQGTLWDNGPEMRVDNWKAMTEQVRNHAGIHACRLPRGDWKSARPPHDFIGSDIIGLVERYGKFVLGTEGWRAEWVIIRELMVCDEITAAKVKAAYPEVPVHVAPRGHWMKKGEF